MRYLASDPDQAALKMWLMNHHTSKVEPLHPGPGGSTALPAHGQLLLSRLNVLSLAAVRSLLAAGVEIVTCDGLDTRRASGVGPLHHQVLGRVLEACAGWGVGKGASSAPPADTAEVERLQALNANLVMQNATLREELALLKAPPLGEPPADFDEVPKKRAPKKEPAAA